MNILFVHEISYLRDPVFEIHALAELLSLRGHKVYAIDYGSECYREVDITRIYRHASVRLIRPVTPKIPAVGRVVYSIIYYYIIYNTIKSRKIDVVLLYSAPTSGVQTIGVARRFGVPVIFRSIDVLHKLVPEYLAGLTKQFEKYVYRNVDKVLTITPALSRYIESLGAKKDRVGILPLGVALEPPDMPLRTQRNGIKPKTGTRILFAGTLPCFSGLDDFLLSFAGLLGGIPDAELVIVGDGKQRELLEKYIRELGLERNVTITGMVPHEDVPRWIETADVCINTFPNSGATRDILPTKVLQYMVAGKPIVSTGLRGMLDASIDGEDQGVVYDDLGYWIQSIQYALKHRDELGEKARRYVVENHGYERVVEQLEQEMRELCESR